jgi:hypothetical protein
VNIVDNRRLARTELSACIGLDNCTPIEHTEAALLRGIGYALLEVADAIRAQTDALVNTGVVTR